jgi:hypothetical protein
MNMIRCWKKFMQILNRESDSGLWTPPAQPGFQGSTLDQLVQAYQAYLQVRAPDQYRLFQDRLRSNPDGAKAEAAVFSWLRFEKLTPSINEKPGQTGADFLCTPFGGQPFIVEVTSLNSVSTTTHSHLFDKGMLDGVAGHFSMITPQLVAKADSKTRQLATAATGSAGVLAICLLHRGAPILLSTLAAKWLLLSDPRIEVPITATGEPGETAGVVYDFKYSVFLESRDSTIVPVRQSISAILFISVFDRHNEIVGLLHPNPVTALNHRIFPKVPFLRLLWPITNSVEMDWIVGDPSPAHTDQWPVVLTQEELTEK